MPRSLPVHLVAIVVFIATTAFVVARTGPRLPELNRDVAVGAGALLVVGWLALLAPRMSPRNRGRPESDWRRHDKAIMWLGNAGTVIGFWWLLPYGDEPLRLMAVIFLFGPVMVEVLASIQRPPAPERFPIAPLTLQASTALYYLVHWEAYSAAVILFSIAYGYVVVTLGRIVQRSVNRTYAARQAAEAALREVAAERDAKTRFLTSASHDLGQPLQAARLFFDQAMRSRTTAQRRVAARKVGWAFDATEQLLTQMLDHLRLESGTISPHMGAAAVGPLIARIAEMNEPAARLAGVELVALPSRLGAQADPALAERALGNLVANAIRHAKARRVLIGARRSGERVRLWVIDDGVGVGEADAARVFDDFVQGAHGDEVRGGFGLGLASARRMAELMGGKVGLEPKWRRGSAFWLELNPADREGSA
jgi:signal transduction histidine kinase